MIQDKNSSIGYGGNEVQFGCNRNTGGLAACRGWAWRRGLSTNREKETRITASEPTV